jgi:hypothetical protein
LETGEPADRFPRGFEFTGSDMHHVLPRDKVNCCNVIQSDHERPDCSAEFERMPKEATVVWYDELSRPIPHCSWYSLVVGVGSFGEIMGFR